VINRRSRVGRRGFADEIHDRLSSNKMRAKAGDCRQGVHRPEATTATPERNQQMQIVSRMSISADGYVTTPDGWPAQLADPAFVSGKSHGIEEFLKGKEAALMGRTTFEPALTADRWPWPNLKVFVLGSTRPPGTPDDVVVDSDPARLLDKVRAANNGGDVHLVGGPRTIETFRAMGALDKLQLVVLPLLLGAGKQLTPSLSPGTPLRFERERTLPGGSVEIIYALR
jgi:dihydrofolate reductase